MKIVLLVFSSLCALSLSAVLPQNVRELTDQDFQTTVQNNNVALVTFLSPTCQYCIKFLPELEKAASSLRSSGSPTLVAKVNCGGGGKSTCSQAKVGTVPTIRLYRNGQPGGDFLGERNAESVVNFVNEANKNRLMRDNYAYNNGYNANSNGYNTNNGYNANSNAYNTNNGYNANSNGYNANNNPGNAAWKPY